MLRCTRISHMCILHIAVCCQRRMECVSTFFLLVLGQSKRTPGSWYPMLKNFMFWHSSYLDVYLAAFALLTFKEIGLSISTPSGAIDWLIILPCVHLFWELVSIWFVLIHLNAFVIVLDIVCRETMVFSGRGHLKSSCVLFALVNILDSFDSVGRGFGVHGFDWSAEQHLGWKFM